MHQASCKPAAPPPPEGQGRQRRRVPFPFAGFAAASGWPAHLNRMCYVLHLILWRPRAAVSSTGLLLCVQSKGDLLLFHCWLLFGLHPLSLTGVPRSGRDSPYTVLEGKFSWALPAHLPVHVSLKRLMLLTKGDPSCRGVQCRPDQAQVLSQQRQFPDVLIFIDNVQGVF